MLDKSIFIPVTFAFSLVLSIYGLFWLDGYSAQKKHTEVQKVAGSYACHIRSDLNQALSASYPIGALIRTQNGDVSGFTELATEMLYLSPGLAALQLHPDGILKHVVPMEGNESSIGNNVLLHPERTKEAFLARDSGKLTLAGPFNLIQGGMGAAARLPIYLDTEKGKKFWGFATALIRFPEVLTPINLPSLVEAGIGYQLSRPDPDTGEKIVIASSNTVLIDDAEEFYISIPNGYWTFKAYPLEGWRDYSILALGIFLALLFISLSTFASFLLVRLQLSHARLETTVKERTQALQYNIERLTESERRLSLSQQVGGIGTWEWNIKTNVVCWTKQVSKLIASSSDQLSSSYEHYIKSIHIDDRDAVIAAIEKSVESGAPYDVDHRVVLPNGNIHWLNQKGSVLRDDNGVATTMLGVAIDITERKLAEEQLKLSSQVFRDTHEGIIITDTNNRIVDVNPAFCRITGYSYQEVIGKNPNMLSSNKQDASVYSNMWQEIDKKGHWQGEVWNCKKDGELYAELLTISVIKNDNDEVVNYVGMFTDITHSKRQQEQLSRMAHYDLLTNLPNRVLLADRISQAMLQCRRHQKSLAVVFVDLDSFKSVNDAYGHSVGDELLIALSERIHGVLREGDSLARIGGDEFVAVLTDLTKIEDCEPILERFLEAASASVTIGSLLLNVSASIGVTFYPQDNADADQLMRHADQAMYIAKASGKNCYHLFDTAQDDAIKVHRESLEAIRHALDNHEFVLHYQPKVNMKTGRVIGVEALIRWQHPERGLLGPFEFLPAIENNPMMMEIGEWVISTALKQISQWQTLEGNLALKVSVNIAAIQLQQPNFTERLTTLLASQPDVAPHYLELEVLETSALKDVNNVSNTMIDCIALGVSFALDDFGTGYSSLTYLRRLPANLIKIDQSFVRDMLHDADDYAIVEGVIALANSFKREVIAEGVETIEHGTALLQLGCNLAQGYGIARPMPGDDIPAWIDDWQPDENWKAYTRSNAQLTRNIND